MAKILSPGSPVYPGATTVSQARKIRFGDATEDYAIYNMQSKRYESAKTGNPWTGPIRGTNAFAQNGTWTDKDPTGTDQTGNLPQFTTIKTEKQPEIAAATGNLLKNQQAAATSTGNAFQDYFKQAMEINAQSREQLKKDQAAFDTSKVESQLPDINRNYQAEQARITGDIAARNKAYAGDTADTIARLNAENARYETAARAAADKAIGANIARTNLYQLTSGTPTSGSGNLSSRYLRAVSDVEVPLQRELSARRYGQITDIERPYARELYGMDQALLGRESALASDFAARDENTMKYLNDLRMRVAGMGRAQAQDYLNNLGIPLGIAQRIIAGDIANLAGIQALDERANYYTVATPYDESRLPVVSSPTYSVPGRSYIGGGDVPIAPSPVIPRGVVESPSPATAGAPTGGGTTYRPYIPSAQTQRIWNMNRARLGYEPYGAYGEYYEPTQ